MKKFALSILVIGMTNVSAEEMLKTRPTMGGPARTDRSDKKVTKVDAPSKKTLDTIKEHTGLEDKTVRAYDLARKHVEKAKHGNDSGLKYLRDNAIQDAEIKKEFNKAYKKMFAGNQDAELIMIVLLAFSLLDLLDNEYEGICRQISNNVEDHNKDHTKESSHKKDKTEKLSKRK